MTGVTRRQRLSTSVADVYRFRKTRDLGALRYAHVVAFGATAPLPDMAVGAWWLLYYGEAVAGFCGVTPCDEIPRAAYLCRAGVIPKHRGKGLQVRMITLRERWARKNGYARMVTETHEAMHSANNLIRSGYRLFAPSAPWSFKGALYFTKSLVVPSRRP